MKHIFFNTNISPNHDKSAAVLSENLARGLTTLEARASRLRNGPCATKRTGDAVLPGHARFLTCPVSVRDDIDLLRVVNVLCYLFQEPFSDVHPQHLQRALG